MTDGQPEELRAGDRVTLVEVPPGYDAFNIVAPMSGVIDLIDSLDTVHCRWDSGARFGVISSARHLLRRDPRRPE